MMVFICLKIYITLTAMLSVKQISKICMLHLLLFLSFHFTLSNGYNATASKADVGVILDESTSLGKIFKTCISMAIEDFYSRNNYSTMIVPHFRESNLGAVDAASAAIDLIKNTQVMAIFGPHRPSQADFVISIGNKVKVPIISPATSPSLSPQESPYFIRSSWCSSSQAKAIAAVVRNFNWREVVLVYEDSNYGSGLLPFLTEELLESNALVSNMTSISPSAENVQILDHLHKLKNMQTRVFVVHMIPSLAWRFFKMARRVGMMDEGYVWIISQVITSLLDSADSETIEAMQGAVGVKAYIPSSSEVSNFTRRWKKRFRKEYPQMDKTELNVFGLWAYDSVTTLAEAVERVGVTTSPKFKKPVDRANSTDLEAIGTSNSDPSFVDLIRNYELKGLSGDFKMSNGELQPSVFEIMNVIGNGANRVGFWRENHGISKGLEGNDAMKSLGAVVWPGQTGDPPKGWGMNANKKLRVGVPLKSRTSGLINVEWDRETGRVNATGFCIDVFEEVMRSMGYPVEYEYIPFENADANSTASNYDRLIDQVFFKNFDVVVAGITISANRSKYADFAIPYIDSGASTVVSIEDDRSTWIFMKPLTRGLWLTIGAYFIFTGFVVWALEHRVNEEFRGPPLQQVGMIFWFSFSTLVFAHKEKVKSNLSRFVVIVWLFVVLVLTSSYTASLTSMLTVQKLDPTDIRDLTKRGEYIGFKEGSFMRAVLDSTNSDSSKFKVFTSFEEYDEALSKGSKNGGVSAVVDTLPSISLFLSKYCHKYTSMGPTYKKSGLGFAFQKGSPLAPDASRAIMEVKENGKMENISNKWFGTENCGCRNGTADASKSLDLDHFKGLFLISGLSSLSALAISLFLFLYKNRSVFTTRASIKRKLSDLAGAFDRERVDKSSTESRTGFEDWERDHTSPSPFSKESPAMFEEIVAAESPAITILCEEGMLSPDAEQRTDQN